MLTEGTFPNVGDLAMSRSSPRVGDGFIRSRCGGRRLIRQPQCAISAYHRMGFSLIWRAQPAAHHPTAHLGLVRFKNSPSVLQASLAGGSSMRFEVDAGGRRCYCEPCRCWSMALPPVPPSWSGRDRDQAPRPRLVVQGRHHPGNPPSSEEQPADGRGPCYDCRRAERTTRRVRTPFSNRCGGWHRSRRCTRPCRCRSTRKSTSTR